LAAENGIVCAWVDTVMQNSSTSRKQAHLEDRLGDPLKRLSRGTLLKAFQTFRKVAGSLENSYSRLQEQVLRLRSELGAANADLSRSLDENRKMRAYLTGLLESLPCGVLVVDSSKNLRIANPAARNMLFEKECELPGISSDEDPLKELLALLPEKFSEAEVELEIDSAPGRTRSIAVARAGLLRGEEGDQDDVYILRETTEQRRVQREKETHRKNQALAEMAMLLAHEIRNPLASLELFAGLLADSARNQPDARQWVEHLQAGLRTLSATVNNVLQFHSQPAAALSSINVVRLLKETAEFLEPLARQKGLVMRLTFCHPDIFIFADCHRLQQVFFNLCLNSFRVMPRGGALQVRVRWSDEEPQTLEIGFEDQGPGIAPEHLESIFKAGFTTTPGSPGLGLAVCKKIVEQHGGAIRAESREGKGARFVIALPVSGAVR
jgi:signal transduction histidine kinase